MRRSSFLYWIFAALVVGLVLAGLEFRHALNADAVAYLRIASYYATGKWALAVSGYWGPMISWVLALLLKVGVPSLVAARLFMGVSAAVFYWGCIAIFRAFGLPQKWVRTGAVLSAGASVYWSVQFITPDLLLSGLVGFAVNRMITTGFRTSTGAVASGLFWGLAYLTKAVALPLALVATTVFGWLAWRKERPTREFLVKRVAFQLIIFLFVCAPWVLVLSMKYHRPTFSTTAAISHTLTGPPNMDRYHPFARSIQPPEPGRITSWEEPSRAAYNFWSPLENAAYARHELNVLARNLSTAFTLLASLNLAWLILFVELGLGLLHRRSLAVSATTSWGRALILPALLVFIYLPTYFTLTEQRFFYAAFPFLFCAVGLWALSGTCGPAPALRIGPGAGRPLAIAGAVLPLLASLFIVGARPKIAGDYAADLASRLEHAQLAGPVVGSAMLPGGRTALYVAFLLNQPWYGDQLQPTPTDFQRSGARLALVIRGSALAAALEQDPGFVDLDARLFAGPEQANEYPVKVFEMPRGQARAHPPS